MRTRHVRPQEDVTALAELATARCPHLMSWWVTSLFVDGVDVDVARVVESDAGPLAFAAVTHRHGRPAHQRWVNLYVADRVAGQGIGGALFAECLAGVAPGSTELWAQVFDGDDHSMAVARHWGFEPVQLSVTSLVDLDPASTARFPDLPDDVTVEPCADLDPPDPAAFDAMLAASQTNPEARNSHVMTREEMRGWVDEGEVPVGSLLRVGGVPAAVSFGSVVVEDGIGGVGYTGVDPAHRGRGLARAVKQHLHHQAAALGVRRLYTDNEENNAGIRRVNTELGYVPQYGVHRLRRRLTEKPGARGGS